MLQFSLSVPARRRRISSICWPSVDASKRMESGVSENRDRFEAAGGVMIDFRDDFEGCNLRTIDRYINDGRTED